MARRAVLWAMAFLCLSVGLEPRLARAQTATPADVAPAAAPASAAAQATREAAPNRPAPTQLAPVEVRSGTVDDTQLRRQSTAGKITVGRDEIERYGDSTVGDLLKRLPGVTTQGRPGRGGEIRMRGLGSGYTQILLDGERVPRGFDIDSLSPEQIERIEIRARPPPRPARGRLPAPSTSSRARASARSSMTCASRPRSRTTHCSRACLGRVTTA